MNVMDESNNGEMKRPIIKTSPEVRFGFKTISRFPDPDVSLHVMSERGKTRMVLSFPCFECDYALQVCEECIGERESCELMRKLNYTNEDIWVRFVRGKEPPKSILEASRHAVEPSRRTSKRSRKTASGNSVKLNVSASTSIYQLKMMIWESFGVCLLEECALLCSLIFSLAFSKA